ncbi:MAG: hypothetical protein WDO16_14685 [Bacteroidota bacterium]
MANNLVESIQKSLGFPVLQKIDPNIQETKEKILREPQEKLAQAAIPAVLTAIYQYTRTEEGGTTILSEPDHADWLDVIFKGKEKVAVEKVARYAGVAENEAESAMENIADEAVITIKSSAGTNPTPATVKSLMSDQRHGILVYLPAAMQMGELLNEESLDDRTNKMEGPISNFMHAIENKLSGNDESKYP